MPYEIKPFEPAFELIYAHTTGEIRGESVKSDKSFEQSNRLLSLEHSNFANKSLKQKKNHIYYISPYLLECVIIRTMHVAQYYKFTIYD